MGGPATLKQKALTPANVAPRVTEAQGRGPLAGHTLTTRTHIRRRATGSCERSNSRCKQKLQANTFAQTAGTERVQALPPIQTHTHSLYRYMLTQKLQANTFAQTAGTERVQALPPIQTHTHSLYRYTLTQKLQANTCAQTAGTERVQALPPIQTHTHSLYRYMLTQKLQANTFAQTAGTERVQALPPIQTHTHSLYRYMLTQKLQANTCAQTAGTERVQALPPIQTHTHSLYRYTLTQKLQVHGYTKNYQHTRTTGTRAHPKLQRAHKQKLEMSQSESTSEGIVCLQTRPRRDGREAGEGLRPSLPERQEETASRSDASRCQRAGFNPRRCPLEGLYVLSL
ncbi:uncharacterized protein LOC132384033 [Hypanus sabinus]|uniref:uncharacterized protein LOC132384033 n=1 Tax=Hypanus sabinus TaxID=79690 RepID=UPI0028C432B6|nr:uncharacterized protein LOC132384033 [Hypanus sabinus]